MDNSRYFENEKRLATFFMLQNISEVNVSFDGSGDSGQIDFIYFWSNSNIVEPEGQICVYPELRSVFHPEKGWVQEYADETLVPIKKAVEMHVYEALSKSNVDWYNNDGGYGEWVWKSDNRISFEIYVREVTPDLALKQITRTGSAATLDDPNEDENV